MTTATSSRRDPHLLFPATDTTHRRRPRTKSRRQHRHSWLILTGAVHVRGEHLPNTAVWSTRRCAVRTTNGIPSVHRVNDGRPAPANPHTEVGFVISVARSVAPAPNSSPRRALRHDTAQQGDGSWTPHPQRPRLGQASTRTNFLAIADQSGARCDVLTILRRTRPLGETPLSCRSPVAVPPSDRRHGR